jgi:hypothetical protein
VYGAILAHTEKLVAEVGPEAASVLIREGAEAPKLTAASPRMLVMAEKVR